MYSQPEKNETREAPPYKPPPTAPPAPRNKVEEFVRKQLDVFHRHPAMFFLMKGILFLVLLVPLLSKSAS